MRAVSLVCLIVVGVSGWSAGCFDPRRIDCVVSCGVADACPRGMACSRGLCTARGVCPSSDAAATQAVAACSAGARRCHQQAIERCDSLLAAGSTAEAGSSWQEETVCSDPAPVCLRTEADVYRCAACATGSQRCAGAEVQVCDATNNWAIIEICNAPDSACEAGACVPSLRVASGGAHNCVLHRDGQVKCWGANADGQLGSGAGVEEKGENRGDDPGEMGSALPAVDLGAGRSGRSIAAGGRHTCVLDSDGQVQCWGDNQSGQLGRGEQRTGPVELGPGRSAQAIAAGVAHTCALLDTGDLKCWGDNYFGQLGLGNRESRGDDAGEMGGALPAVELGPGRTARAVAAGAYHTCALLDNGELRCWGWNDYGQLGMGDTDARGDDPDETPDTLPAVPLGQVGAVRAIAAGGMHTCALLETGRLKCWGLARSGQLGLGDRNNRGDDAGDMGNQLPPVDLGSGAKARAVAAGGYHTCALLEGEGLVKCWGGAAFGALGLEDGDNRGDGPGEMGDLLPTLSLGLGQPEADSGRVMAISAGNDHGCALFETGSLKCWGINRRGQLGLGDVENRGNSLGQMGDALPFVDTLGPPR